MYLYLGDCNFTDGNWDNPPVVTPVGVNPEFQMFWKKNAGILEYYQRLAFHTN